MYDNMNSYQKAALRVDEAVHQPSPQTPFPPTVSKDYYYGNPLAYACKTAVRDGEVNCSAKPSVLYWIFLCDESAEMVLTQLTEHYNITLNGNT